MQRRVVLCGAERPKSVYLSKSPPRTPAYQTPKYKVQGRMILSLTPQEIVADIFREFDAAFCASVPSETPPLIGTEIFWDAFEQNPLEDQAQTSISNFGDSGYWTDNDGAGPVPWNSCNDYPHLPDHSTAISSLQDLGILKHSPSKMLTVIFRIHGTQA